MPGNSKAAVKEAHACDGGDVHVLPIVQFWLQFEQDIVQLNAKLNELDGSTASASGHVPTIPYSSHSNSISNNFENNNNNSSYNAGNCSGTGLSSSPISFGTPTRSPSSINSSLHIVSPSSIPSSTASLLPSPALVPAESPGNPQSRSPASSTSPTTLSPEIVKNAFLSHGSSTVRYFDYFDGEVLCYFHVNKPETVSALDLQAPASQPSRFVRADRMKKHLVKTHDKIDKDLFPILPVSMLVRLCEVGWVLHEDLTKSYNINSGVGSMLDDARLITLRDTTDDRSILSDSERQLLNDLDRRASAVCKAENISFAEAKKARARQLLTESSEKLVTVDKYFPSTKKKALPIGLNPKDIPAILNGINFCVYLIRNALPFSLGPKLKGETFILPGKYDELHLNKYLDVLFAVAMQCMHNMLHEAPAFSVSFDVWTSRGCRHGYIGITYRFTDSNFVAHEFGLDYWRMSCNHNSFNIAAAVSKRIEVHSAPKQLFFSSSTDGASSVVKASKALCAYLNEVSDSPESDINFDEDDAEVDRAVNCAAHLVQLVLKDFCKIQMVATLLSRIHDIASVVKHSEKLQRELAELKKNLGMSVQTLKLSSNTRWVYHFEMVHSFLDNFTLLKLAFANGLFVKTTCKDMLFFTDREKLNIQTIEKVLVLIKEFVIFMEYDSVLVAPYICDLADVLFNRVVEILNSPLCPIEMHHPLNVLLKSINDRCSPYYMISCPSTWARFLYPATAATAVPLTNELRINLIGFIAQWSYFSEKLNFARDEYTEAVATERAQFIASNRKSNLSSNTRYPNSRASTNTINGTSPEEVPDRLIDLVSSYLFDLREYVKVNKPPHHPSTVAFPPLNLSPEERKNFKTKQCAFEMMKYSTTAMQSLTQHNPAMKELLRIILCTPASSAEVERNFSSSALIDVAKRNRLNPAKFEKLCILKNFFIKWEKMNKLNEFLKTVHDAVRMLPPSEFADAIIDVQ